MTDKRELALLALSKATRIRKAAGKKPSEAISIYDFVEDHGVTVRFMDTPSMEGMYQKDNKPQILVTSLRPAGRQAFTCGHEFGHHIFEHGSRIDDSSFNGFVSNNDEEYLADCFSGFLLMPKVAVSQAFSNRDWDWQKATPEQFFSIAGYFGVGYSTLVNHMSISLGLISFDQKSNLLKSYPKEIKRNLVGEYVDENILVISSSWNGRPIDIQVGDIVLTPKEIEIEGSCLKKGSVSDNQQTFIGAKPGVGRIFDPKGHWANVVRVARKGYIGLSKYRHLEDPDNE
jgi:Zn-dependent peptidase ImmA (M78 family)